MHKVGSAPRANVAIYDCPPVVGKTLSSRLRTYGYDVTYNEKLTDKTADKSADVWIAKWTYQFNGGFLRSSHPKKGIITLTAGTDHIDLKAIQELGLVVENCSFSSNSVAEHAMALAFRGLNHGCALPPLGRGKLIFTNFSDAYAEQAVAHILMRGRQIDQSVERARTYDYRRLDEPWYNEELVGSKVLILGGDRPAFKLARILKDGFYCELFGHGTSDEMEGYGVKTVGAIEFLKLVGEAEYVFFCNDRYGLVKQSEAIEPSKLGEPDMRFSGSNVAVLGAGKIGSRIARMCRMGFNCNVKAFNNSQNTELVSMGVEYAKTLREAIADANFIFVALRVMKGDKPMIGYEEIANLDSSRPRMIINIARDAVIDSEPFYSFLCNGGVMAYATDVVPNDYILWKSAVSGVKIEPDDTTKKFISHSAVVATPHEADCSRQSLSRLVSEVVGLLDQLFR